MDSFPLLKKPSFTQSKLGAQSMLKQAWLLFSNHKQALLPGALQTALATLFAWTALSAMVTAEEPTVITPFIFLLVCVAAIILRARQAAFTAQTVLANNDGSLDDGSLESIVRFQRLTLTSFLTTITGLIVLSLALFLLVVVPLCMWGWTAAWGGTMDNLARVQIAIWSLPFVSLGGFLLFLASTIQLALPAAALESDEIWGFAALWRSWNLGKGCRLRLLAMYSAIQVVLCTVAVLFVLAVWKVWDKLFDVSETETIAGNLALFVVYVTVACGSLAAFALSMAYFQVFWLVVYMRACDAAGESEGLQLCQNPDLEEGN